MTDALQSKMRLILQGQIKFTSENLGFNMLLSRTQHKISEQEASVDDCMEEIELFLDRFENIMKSELEKIEAL